MKLSLFMFFSFFVFLAFGVDTYKHTKQKVACICLVNFSSNSPENSKIPRKIHEKYIFQRSTDLNFKNFPFDVYHRATAQGNWTKQTVKKLNLWGKRLETKVLGYEPDILLIHSILLIDHSPSYLFIWSSLWRTGNWLYSCESHSTTRISSMFSPPCNFILNIRSVKWLR